MSRQIEASQTINSNKKRNLLPPPINILGLTDHSQVKALMSTVTNKDYKLTALNNNVWEICTADAESYRDLAKKLNTDKIQWYTYENKSCRPIKIMARGLHPTCDRQDILEDLRQRGLKPIDAVNIIKREKDVDNKGNNVVRKIGLPLFMITFDQEEKSENIFGLKSILNMKVKIEPLRKTSNLIPQCKRCQGFNHTQKYCSREPRCVKCSGKHLTRDCKVDRITPLTCINCKEQHPIVEVARLQRNSKK